MFDARVKREVVCGHLRSRVASGVLGVSRGCTALQLGGAQYGLLLGGGGCGGGFPFPSDSGKVIHTIESNSWLKWLLPCTRNRTEQ